MNHKRFVLMFELWGCSLYMLVFDSVHYNVKHRCRERAYICLLFGIRTTGWGYQPERERERKCVCVFAICSTQRWYASEINPVPCLPMRFGRLQLDVKFCLDKLEFFGKGFMCILDHRHYTLQLQTFIQTQLLIWCPGPKSIFQYLGC